MPSNVISRRTVREAFAALLDTAFDSTWDVFNYNIAKFNGKAKNIMVVSAGSRRTITGARSIESANDFRFRVFVFVLHQVQPVQSTNSPTAGVNKTINVPNTTNFANGNTVTIADATNSENAVINATVILNTSIQVATLVNSYTTPKVYAWTPQNSDDEIDAAEKKVTDVCNDNQSNTNWSRLYVDGQGETMIVDEGGQTFRLEIITIRTDNY